MHPVKVDSEILHLNPYVPGLPIDEVRRRYGVKDVYKLASNENALGPSQKTIRAILDSLSHVQRYPDGACFELKQAMANYFGVGADFLAFGTGSDDLFQLLIRAYCHPGENILTGQYAFVAYKIAAQTARVGTIEAPANEDFSVPIHRLIESWNPSVKIIFIANPNNPTGNYYSSDEIKNVLNAFGNRDDVLLVFDEAYHEFVRATDYQSCLNLVQEYSNVCVLRTFSKIFGLAGLRLGVLISQPEIASVINRMRQPFNANSVVQNAAIAAVQDNEHIQKSRELAWEGLDYFYKELDRLGLPYVSSQGNFVLVDTLRDSKLVDQSLLKRGIILRPLLNYGLVRHLRMSVGLKHENQAAISALEEVLSEIPLREGRA
jgi:histidinol-phosphate aminotransferase